MSTPPPSEIAAPSSPLEQFLRWALAAAEALAKLHQSGIIHQNIRPDTMRSDRRGSGVELVGAQPGHAAEAQVLKLPMSALPYIAPEQTERMEGALDHRADLYSLGIVLYERWAKLLPFHAEDPLGWVHCHVARAPRPLSEAAPGTPAIVSEIVMKLIAKSPDERYQSARGLVLDLERCLAELSTKGRIDPFPLGKRDIWDKLRAAGHMYGREKELATLHEAVRRAATAQRPELLLVTGPSGIGKTALAREMPKSGRERALFLWGKFEQHRRDIPYATIGQAFGELVQKLLAMPEAELSAVRERLEAALGVNAQLIVELVPQLELVLGKQQAPVNLPAAEAQSRFNLTFESFLGALADAERSIVLVLDDLQWADLGSLDLLQHVLSQPVLRNVLIVGIYRAEEVLLGHPLSAMLGAVRDAAAPVTALTVGPLAQSHLSDLVVDLFSCERAEAEPLAGLLWAKTHGNPFFAVQLLGVLREEQLIVFDARHWTWRWNMAQIEAKEVTDDLVQLVLGKLRRLPEPTLETLKIAACIGNEFTVDLAATLCAKPQEQIRTDLEPAISEGILLQGTKGYKFLHDRLVNAAYSLIPEPERTALHLRLGWLLLERTPADRLDSVLFDVVNLLNMGVAHVETAKDRRRVAELELRAGRKAKAAAAAKIGASYLATGISLLPEDAWEADYTLLHGLHLELAECELLRGRFDEAGRLCTLLMERSRTKVDRAAAYRIKILMATAQLHNAGAIEAGMACLRMLGIDLPASPSNDDVLAEVEWIRTRLTSQPVEDLINLPLMSDPDMIAVVETLVAIFPPAMYSAPNLAHLTVARNVRLSILHGNTPASVHGYATLGSILCSRLGQFHEGYRFGKLATELSARPGFGSFHVEAAGTFAIVVLPFTRPIREAIDYLRSAFRAGHDTGKLIYACGVSLQAALSQLEAGSPLEVVFEAVAASLEFLTNAKPGFFSDSLIGLKRLIHSLRGETERIGSLSGADFDEDAFDAYLRDRSIPAARLCFGLYRLMARYLGRDFSGAYAEALAVEQLLWSGIYTMPETEYDYFGALAAAAVYDNASEAERVTLRQRLLEHESKLRRWADSCPENFAGKHALVCAELARIEGRTDDAARQYDKAVRLGRDSGFCHDEAVACEAAARFYLAREFAILPAAYLQQARASFKHWGAVAKVQQLEALYSTLLAEPSREPAPPAEPATGPMDTLAAAKASEAISSEMSPEELLATLMRIVVEHAGAQRCSLLLPSREGLDVAAEIVSSHDGAHVEISRGGQAPSPDTFPVSIAHYVRRTREKVILDDAAAQARFSTDRYIAAAQPRSLLCAPILRRGEVAGILYLENRLVRGAFTARKLALLEFLSAISLENALLAQDLERETAERTQAEKTLRQSEARLARLVETANVVPWEADRHTGRFTYVGPQAVQMLGYPQEAWYVDGFLREKTQLEDRETALSHLLAPTSDEGFDFRMSAADGRTVWLHNVISARGAGESGVLGGFLFDVTDRKQAEATLKEKLRIIETQQASIQRLSTPIIEVWEGVLTLPVLGIVDGPRAEQMMGAVLEAVTQRSAKYMIIDLTGVDAVDTRSADHIIKIARAVQLLGAQGIVVGIRPDVAQTIVTMGVDLSALLTLGNLRSALLLCMRSPRDVRPQTAKRDSR